MMAMWHGTPRLYSQRKAWEREIYHYGVKNENYRYRVFVYYVSSFT